MREGISPSRHAIHREAIYIMAWGRYLLVWSPGRVSERSGRFVIRLRCQIEAFATPFGHDGDHLLAHPPGLALGSDVRQWDVRLADQADSALAAYRPLTGHALLRAHLEAHRLRLAVNHRLDPCLPADLREDPERAHQ